MITLQQAIESVGGVNGAATICGVSPRAVYKWLKRNSLPRTDYTGETNYADALASRATSPSFTGAELRDQLRQRSA